MKSSSRGEEGNEGGGKREVGGSEGRGRQIGKVEERTRNWNRRGLSQPFPPTHLADRMMHSSHVPRVSIDRC
eukprot:6192221-Pleurochrysis_carterae.AAC.9